MTLASTPATAAEAKYVDPAPTEKFVLERFAASVRQTLARMPDAFPGSCEGGRWSAAPASSWLAVFLPAQCLLLWRATQDDGFRSAAARLLVRIAPYRNEAKVNYDLGFLYYFGAALAASLGCGAEHRAAALEAAQRMLSLVHPRAGVICHAFPERIALFGDHAISTTVDVFPNLSLLWWASSASGDPRFAHAARRRLAAALPWLMRADGSTAQLADFDAGTGAFLRHGTRNGAHPDSAWSRGQAWTIFGLVEAARHCPRDAEIRAAFVKAIDFWRRQMDDDALPPWDFAQRADAPDSSAAAIVAAALARADQAGIAVADGEAMRRKLRRSLFRNLTGAGQDGALSRGCHHHPRREGIGGATPFGDYFLLESLVGPLW